MTSTQRCVWNQFGRGSLMRIKIIGAGIGGLVSAAALKADGHEVTVYERRPDAGATGAGLTLFNNAFSALDALNLGDTVREVSSSAIGRVRSGQRQPSGRWLVSLPPSSTPSVWSLHRADLHQVLAGQLQPGTLKFSQEVYVSADGAPVLTVNGQPKECDLIIAADGICSEARQQWGLDHGLRYAGYTAWRGITASDAHFANDAGETWGRGLRFGIVPLPDNRIYWFATSQTPQGGTDADASQTVHRLFGSWHRPIPEIIAATEPETILRHDIFDLADLPSTFVHRRGVLLGDAAHAMTPDIGQGAGQAIEDAATLTLLLRGATIHNLDQVLERYDNLRRPRTRAFWRLARTTGRIAQLSNPGVALLRDTGLRALPASVLARSMARVHRWEAPTSTT